MSLTPLASFAANDPLPSKSTSCSSLLDASPRQNTLQISSATHDLITAAMEKDFTQRYSYEPIRQLRQMGASQVDLETLTRSPLRETLDRIGGRQPRLKLAMVSLSQAVADPNLLNPGASITEFEAYFKLESERVAVSQIIEFGDSPTEDYGMAVESLKIAILSGQKDLAREAYLQCFRFNNFNELTALAVETNNDEVLLQVGRLSIARYLFYSRSSNYLNDGLEALVEIQGPLKVQAVELLLSFSDLITSGSIMENVGQVRTPLLKVNQSQYYGNALSSLLSAGQLVGRFRRDSRSYHYIMKFSDERIKDRVRKLINKSLDENVTLGSIDLINAISALGSTGYAKSVATRIFNQRNRLAMVGDEPRQALRAHSIAHLSLSVAMLSGDPSFIRQHLQRVIQDISEISQPFYLLDNVAFIPFETLMLVQDFIVQLLDQADLNKIQREYLKESLAELIYDQNRKESLNPTLHREGMFLRQDTFRHYFKSIKFALEHPSGYQGYWGRYLNAVNARDKDALRAVYNDMMKDGRAMDAVYAAIALAALESGEDLVLLWRALTNSQQLIE